MREATRQLIEAAMEHQKRKFGKYPIAETRQSLSILTEELGEVARAINEKSATETLEHEIIQVIAVSIAWLEGDLHYGAIK
jgi:NTP pyrophosphatase (non-canonical NTP hydrolase)